jgi:hypothetical protein
MKDKIFTTTAIFENNHYKHFGICVLSASLYGDKEEDIVELKMKISYDQKLPDERLKKQLIADYWGWYDFEKEKMSLIFPQRFLLNMCFPYGMKACEDNNEGKAYRLEII